MVQALHVVCAGANVIMNGMANASEFKDTDVTNDISFETLAPLAMYHDQYFKYTATCNGVGLIYVDGNDNFTSAEVDVWSGTCAIPVMQRVSSSADEYTADVMATATLSFSRGCTGTVCSNRLQYIATNGTEYIFRVGSSSASNNTGEIGNFAYNITAACVVPASNDATVPTMVMANKTYYNSNVNGSVAANDCGSGNNVYFGYTAECTGDVSIIILKDPSVSYDGFHGEDLKLGFYNYSALPFDTTVTGSPACKDDPAMISVYRNVTQVPVRQLGGVVVLPLVVEGGVVMGKKYLIQVSSFSSSKAPFALMIDGPYNCQAGAPATPTAATSSGSVLSLSAFVGAMVFSM
jgi:hypothetical protein